MYIRNIFYIFYPTKVSNRLFIYGMMIGISSIISKSIAFAWFK